MHNLTTTITTIYPHSYTRIVDALRVIYIHGDNKRGLIGACIIFKKAKKKQEIHDFLQRSQERVILKKLSF